MATHSSVLAWRIPGTGEPGGLPSMGSHRVRHDWSDLAAAAAWTSYYVLSSIKQLTFYFPEASYIFWRLYKNCIYTSLCVLNSVALNVFSWTALKTKRWMCYLKTFYINLLIPWLASETACPQGGCFYNVPWNLPPPNLWSMCLITRSKIPTIIIIILGYVIFLFQG